MSQQTHQFETETETKSRWLFDALIGDKFAPTIERSVSAIPLQLILEQLPLGEELEVRTDNGGTDNFNFLYWTTAENREAAIAKSIASLIPLLHEVGVEHPLILRALIGSDVESSEDATVAADHAQRDLEAGLVDSPQDF